MSELSSDALITSVLNDMSACLNNEQLILLKNTLFIKLHDVQLTKATYEVATTPDTNDVTLLQYFEISLRTANKSDKTIKQYIRAVWKLREFEKKNLRDITHMDIKHYFAMKQKDHKWNDKSTENNYNYINAFYRFLCDEDYIDKNPMRKVQRVKVTKKIKKPYTSTDMESMKCACGTDTRKMALIEFLLSTALRVESVHRLKWKDLDFTKRKVITIVKGGDTKEFRFNESTEFYLRKYFRDRMIKENRTREQLLERPLFAGAKRDRVTKDFEALSCGGIRYVLNTLKEETHIEKLHPHRFRKTFACNAIERGMPMEEVKEHLGHKNIQTTLIYADITDSKLDTSYKQYCS